MWKCKQCDVYRIFNQSILSPKIETGIWIRTKSHEMGPFNQSILSPKLFVEKYYRNSKCTLVTRPETFIRDLDSIRDSIRIRSEIRSGSDPKIQIFGGAELGSG